MALDNVRAHKFRSFLTVLGIVIGVTTVIAIASILTGLRANIVNFVEEYGTNNIYAFHLSTGISFSHDRSERTRKPLRPEDGEAIKELASAVEDVANDGFIEWNFDKTLTYAGQTYKQGNLEGVSANYGTITNLSLQAGRFISDIDDQHRRDVMVIGKGAAEALFQQGLDSIVGKEVMMNGKPFEIIGVLEPRKGNLLGQSEENQVLIPFRTMRKVSPRSEWMMLTIRARSGQLPKALDQVEDILRRQRGVKYDEKNNFDLTTADRFIEQFDSITAMVGLVAIALSSVEYHAGERHRAHFRNRGEKGYRRAPPRYHQSVLVRGDDADVSGGRVGSAVSDRRESDHRSYLPRAPGVRSTVGSDHRIGGLYRNWLDLRSMACKKSSSARSDRSAQV